MSKSDSVTLRLPETGYVRQRQLIPHFLPFTAATLWRKVKTGEFPQPIKLGRKITAWKAEDVRAWMDKANRGDFA